MYYYLVYPVSGDTRVVCFSKLEDAKGYILGPMMKEILDDTEHEFRNEPLIDRQRKVLMMFEDVDMLDAPCMIDGVMLFKGELLVPRFEEKKMLTLVGFKNDQ